MGGVKSIFAALNGEHIDAIVVFTVESRFGSFDSDECDFPGIGEIIDTGV